jgi:hypothetical protein
MLWNAFAHTTSTSIEHAFYMLSDFKNEVKNVGDSLRTLIDPLTLSPTTSKKLFLLLQATNSLYLHVAAVLNAVDFFRATDGIGVDFSQLREAILETISQDTLMHMWRPKSTIETMDSLLGAAEQMGTCAAVLHAIIERARSPADDEGPDPFRDSLISMDSVPRISSVSDTGPRGESEKEGIGPRFIKLVQNEQVCVWKHVMGIATRHRFNDALYTIRQHAWVKLMEEEIAPHFLLIQDEPFTYLLLAFCFVDFFTLMSKSGVAGLSAQARALPAFYIVRKGTLKSDLEGMEIQESLRDLVSRDVVLALHKDRVGEQVGICCIHVNPVSGVATITFMGVWSSDTRVCIRECLIQQKWTPHSINLHLTDLLESITMTATEDVKYSFLMSAVLQTFVFRLHTNSAVLQALVQSIDWCEADRVVQRYRSQFLRPRSMVPGRGRLFAQALARTVSRDGLMCLTLKWYNSAMKGVVPSGHDLSYLSDVVERIREALREYTLSAFPPDILGQLELLEIASQPLLSEKYKVRGKLSPRCEFLLCINRMPWSFRQTCLNRTLKMDRKFVLRSWQSRRCEIRLTQPCRTGH